MTPRWVQQSQVRLLILDPGVFSDFVQLIVLICSQRGQRRHEQTAPQNNFQCNVCFHLYKRPLSSSPFSRGINQRAAAACGGRRVMRCWSRSIPPCRVYRSLRESLDYITPRRDTKWCDATLLMILSGRAWDSAGFTGSWKHLQSFMFNPDTTFRSTESVWTSVNSFCFAGCCRRGRTCDGI